MMKLRYSDRVCLECGKVLETLDWLYIDAVYPFCSMTCKNIFYQYDGGKTKKFIAKSLENKNG